MSFKTNGNEEMEQLADYHQATIIDPPSVGEKPLMTKEPIRKRAVHTLTSIKDKAMEVTENGEAIRRAAANASASIQKKAAETTEMASEMGEKYQEWLTTKNGERVEREKLRNEHAVERVQQEHEIRITKTTLDLERKRIRETGTALIDNEVRGIKDSSKIEREKIRAEERRTQEERKHELKVAEIARKQAAQEAKIAQQQAWLAQEQARQRAKIEHQQLKIREKTERQKRRQTTLKVLGISFIIVIVLVVLVVVVLMPTVLRSGMSLM
jgi:hypothetical protein